MNIGGVISVLTEGLWNGFTVTTSAQSLPGPKTILTLYELITTQSTSMSPVETYTGIQELSGSLQPINAQEHQIYNKETVVTDYKFLVAQSQFTSSANEAKLTEKNQLRTGSRVFNIVSSGSRIEGIIPHYRVLLKEVV
jgi:hypothetical protein